MKHILSALLILTPQASTQSARRSATVDLAAKADAAVVAIYSEAEGSIHSGSGSVISPHGYILTNDHVVRNRGGRVLLHDGSVRPFRVVGRSPEKDLAIILVPVKEPLKALPLGRSDDIMTGEPIPPDDMRMIYQKANYFWHSDSSFKRVPSLCSILTARICPPEGGNTEFLNMRAAWDALPPALQATIHPLV
ncbi:MAG: TauD/TfdA family dioxygenase, partial [Chthoniobacteraceae bacterium]